MRLLLLIALSIASFPLLAYAQDTPPTASQTESFQIVQQGLLAYKNDKPRQALALFEKAAELNDPIALDILASAYAEGNYGLEKNMDKAITLWERSSEHGNARADAQLANYYLNNPSSAAVLKKAEKHLKTLVSQGNTTAMANLGLYYIKQGHVFEGIYRITIAAKAGNNSAKNMLLSMGLDSLPPLPGESMASTKTVEKLMPSVREYARRTAAFDCGDDNIQVIDSRILSKPKAHKPEKNTTYNISEEWLTKYCHQEIPVTIHFAFTPNSEDRKNAKLLKEIQEIFEDIEQ